MNNEVLSKLSISDLALERLQARLASQGSPMSKRAGCSVGFLMARCEEALEGRLPPAFYLASIDPGQGKTLAMAEFLKVASDMGRLEKGGALIGVSRWSEIETYVEAMGLSHDQFGVLTSSPELNALGTEDLDNTPLLFTTQQMIFSRVGSRSFKDTSDFHYRGQPRSLRLWDESLIPAQSVAVQRDELGRLLSLRLHYPAYVEEIDRLMDAMDYQEEGRLLTVSAVLKGGPTSREDGLGLDADAIADLVKRLRRMAGQSAWVVNDGSMGKSLVSAGEGLPDDFAPVIVLDASGRARGTYDLWERYRRDLVRLPSAVTDYRRLEVHLWPRTSGKQVMRDPKARDDIIQGIAEVINQDGQGDWLVVHYKADQRFGVDLRALVKVQPERVQFIHWGNHHGTNEFRSIPNVVLVGQLTYRRSQYLGYALASGMPPQEWEREEARVREGERAHHLLQAACRGAVRLVSDGVGGPGRLFIVATPSLGFKEELRLIFPGCVVRDWNVNPTLKGKPKAAADYLLERFSDPQTAKVKKADVRKAIGIAATGTFASHVMANPHFRYFMGGHWIWEDGQHFVRVEPFDAVEDGYVYQPDES